MTKHRIYRAFLPISHQYRQCCRLTGTPNPLGLIVQANRAPHRNIHVSSTLASSDSEKADADWASHFVNVYDAADISGLLGTLGNVKKKKPPSEKPPETPSKWRKVSDQMTEKQLEYLALASEGPTLDLLSKLPDNFTPSRIEYLGCDPGIAHLAQHFPSAEITGVDSSPVMIRAARKALPAPSARYEQVHDIMRWAKDPAPSGPVDLILANGMLHKIRSKERREAIIRALLARLRPGGVLALQVPINNEEWSYKAMDAISKQPGPWREVLKGRKRPGNSDFHFPMEHWYKTLMFDEKTQLCGAVEMWEKTFVYHLKSLKAIVEWEMRMGLRPFMEALPEGSKAREVWLSRYERALGDVGTGYKPMPDGKVLFRYPRLFAVAVKADEG